MKKLSILFFTIIMLIIISSCSNKAFNANFIAFSTECYIAIDNENAKEIYSELKPKILEMSSYFDDYQTNRNAISIYDLNKSRRIARNEILVDILNKALEIKNDTNGCYNPFIGSLTRLWKDSLNNNRIPSQADIDSLLSKMNNTSLEITETEIILNGDGNIDLGGIAKGYALDYIREFLDNKNVESYFIDLGTSSVYSKNYKMNIRLDKPYNSGYIKVFDLNSSGISTSSGEHQNKVIDGIRYHHLISPFDGKPATIYDSISVISSNNTINDSYSTALMSMDLDTIKEIVSLKNIDVIVFKNNEIIYETGDGIWKNLLKI